MDIWAQIARPWPCEALNGSEQRARGFSSQDMGSPGTLNSIHSLGPGVSLLLDTPVVANTVAHF